MCVPPGVPPSYVGANYVTWEYQETLANRNGVGATTYAEEP